MNFKILACILLDYPVKQLVPINPTWKTIVKTKSILATLAFLGASVAAQAVPLAAALSNSNVDLTGNFVYALTMNPNAAGTTVGNATFTSGFSTAGATVSHQNYIQGWHSSTAANSAGLGNVMRSIIWSYGNTNAEVVQLTMSNLQIGTSYKAQLLFGEACCDRGFDIFQNGIKVADDFSPFGLSGNDYGGAAIWADTFVATSTSVVFGLGYYGGHGDYNPILNAATLEQMPSTDVPEPGSLPLLLAGLGAVGFWARRKSVHSAS